MTDSSTNLLLPKSGFHFLLLRKVLYIFCQNISDSHSRSRCLLPLKHWFVIFTYQHNNTLPRFSAAYWIIPWNRKERETLKVLFHKFFHFIRTVLNISFKFFSESFFCVFRFTVKWDENSSIFSLHRINNYWNYSLRSE